jgi:hypothetical protein
MMSWETTVVVKFRWMGIVEDLLEVEAGQKNSQRWKAHRLNAHPSSGFNTPLDLQSLAHNFDVDVRIQPNRHQILCNAS